MSSLRKTFGASARIAFTALAVIVLSTSSVAAELACVSGHNTVVPPCTFDNGLFSLDSTTGNFIGGGGGGGGHHTLVEFSGSTVTIEADITGGALPFAASDNTTGINGAIGTITISSVSGLPIIEDLSLELLSPTLIGTGTVSFGATGTATLPPLTGLPGSTFEDVSLTPTNSITETLNLQLSTGCGAPSASCTGDAIIDGLVIGISTTTVPEPSSVALIGVGLVGLGLAFRRKVN